MRFTAGPPGGSGRGGVARAADIPVRCHADTTSCMIMELNCFHGSRRRAAAALTHAKEERFTAPALPARAEVRSCASLRRSACAVTSLSALRANRLSA